MTDKTCGCIGCTESANAVIEKEGKRRTVCEDHIAGYDVEVRL